MDDVQTGLKQTRQAGIDILKAICIMLVVVWHCQPFKSSMFPGDQFLLQIVRQTINFFYFNISLLAVPSFIFASLYLFFTKMSESDDYWKKRFLRLVQVYVFWVGVQFILYVLLGGDLPLPLKTIFRSGGPDLPLSTFMNPVPSIFYFLFALMVCTLLAFFFWKLPDKLKLPVAVLVIAASVLYFLAAAVWTVSIDTRSMKNYYIYVPAAYLLYRYRERMISCRWIFFIFFVASLVMETAFGWRTPPYGRLSIFCGSFFLMSVFVSGWTRAWQPVSLLSRYSLGIFALHGYFMVAVSTLYYMLSGQKRVATLAGGILQFAAIFFLTCLCIWLMSKTSLRKYVS
jgi:peptidoglycan/LPS O-acetylase OafA/YrhL